MPTPGLKCDMRAHERLDEHASRLSVLEKDIKLHTKALAENTALTREVVAKTTEVVNNTAELVELMKGLKGLRTLVVWGAPIVAAIVALIAYIRGYK